MDVTSDNYKRSMIEYKARFAARIREAQEELGLTTAQLAEGLGVTPTSILYYRNAQRLPNLPTMVRLADILGKTCDELMRV